MSYVRRESLFFAAARQKAGLTQQELAKALGHANAQFVSNIERGVSKLPNTSVRKFCEITGARLTTYATIKLAQARRYVREEIYG